MSSKENDNIMDLEEMIQAQMQPELEGEKNPLSVFKIDKNLENAYNARASVKNTEDLIQNFALNAAEFTNSISSKVDYNLAYGDFERQVMDLFWPHNVSDASIVMFIHGGYWRSLSKNDFSHMAKGLLNHKFCVAVPSYRLCPEVEINDIINDLRKACLYLWRRHNKPITVIGHSAGAHLAACLLATDWQNLEPYAPEDLVTKGTLISGIFDLPPLLQTSFNADLKMGEESAKAASPIHYTVDTDRQVNILVGAKEPSGFHEQSKKLHDIWHLLGVDVTYKTVENANHFNILDPLTDHKSDLIHSLIDLHNKKPHEPIKIPSKSLEERVKENMQKNAVEADQPEEALIENNPKASPVNNIHDDLTHINGINDELAEKLFNVGIKSYSQLALLTDQNIPVFERILDRKGFVKKHKIVEQAKKFEALRGNENAAESHSFYKRRDDKSEKPKQDDLTLINGIGPVYKERLYSVGITSFEHLALVSNDEAKIMDKQLDLNERIFIDDWMGQASEFLKK